MYTFYGDMQEPNYEIQLLLPHKGNQPKVNNRSRMAFAAGAEYVPLFHVHMVSH